MIQAKARISAAIPGNSNILLIGLPSAQSRKSRGVQNYGSAASRTRLKHITNPQAPGQIRWSMARRGVASVPAKGEASASQSLGGSGGGDGDGGDDKKILKPAAEPKLASEQSGTLGHAQHMVDLLLDIVPGTSDGTYPALDQYVSFTRDLTRQIKNKKIDEVNEKFDGSTSILLGFDAEGRPFIAYKHGLKKDGESVIVRNADEALARFNGAPMGRMFAAVITHLKEVMEKFPVKDVIFQGDMLFSPEKDRRKIKPRSVKFKANRLEYEVKKGSPHFEGISAAKVGMAIHSISQRVLNPQTGNVTKSSALDNDQLVADFVAAINGGDVFAVDPWSRDVAVDLDPAKEFNAEKETEFESLLKHVEENYRSLSPEFRAAWKMFKGDFDVFLNSGLKVGKRGGIYRAAKAGEPFDYEYLKGKLLKWYHQRTLTYAVDEVGNFEPLT